jgi:hypothetical protein
MKKNMIIGAIVLLVIAICMYPIFTKKSGGSLNSSGSLKLYLIEDDSIQRSLVDEYKIIESRIFKDLKPLIEKEEEFKKSVETYKKIYESSLNYDLKDAFRLASKNTAYFIELWARMNNMNFKLVEFDQFKDEADVLNMA